MVSLCLTVSHFTFIQQYRPRMADLSPERRAHVQALRHGQYIRRKARLGELAREFICVILVYTEYHG